jgi:hypothetical protein
MWGKLLTLTSVYGKTRLSIIYVIIHRLVVNTCRQEGKRNATLGCTFTRALCQEGEFSLKCLDNFRPCA